MRDSGPVSFLRVSLRIEDSRDADLTISLVSPAGKPVTLVRQRGGHGAGLGTGTGCSGQLATFEDDGSPLATAQAPFGEGPYAPEQPLAALNGQEAKGRWTLRVEDGAPGASGTLECFQLDLSRDIVESERAARAGLTAIVSYRESDGLYRDVRVKLVRRGTVAVDGPLPAGPAPYARPLPPVVRDLDGDGEPEAIVDVFTGGAHCCTVSRIYRWDGARGRYVSIVRNWGNAGYRIADLDRNGHPELVSDDDRFAYAFTSYAASARPIQVWRYRQGRLVDVTRAFPKEVRADAALAWRGYLDQRTSPDGDVRGLLAAFMADEYLLGREASGWRLVDAAVRRGELSGSRAPGPWPAGRAYLTQLRAFLEKTGYAG